MITWNPSVQNDTNWKFSIIIPSWNNLEFLQLCIRSIERNSYFTHQIIVHVNEGTDGTLDWIKQNGFAHTHCDYNVGVCWAMNACRALVMTDYIVFVNDDMYMLPNWDIELCNEIERLPSKYFYLSSTTIEPRVSPHPGILAPFNYGTTPSSFEEDRLLAEFKQIKGSDWSGSTWPPCIVHRDIWDLIGGYSIEYYPGLYSDPDLSMKLYEAGVRHFKGIDASRAYHFGSKSTKRITMNNGSKQFLNKWGITSASFMRIILKRGQPYEQITTIDRKQLNIAQCKSNLKRFIWSFTGIGRTKGKYSYNNGL